MRFFLSRERRRSGGLDNWPGHPIRPASVSCRQALSATETNYNESWPRALVPYERIYGVKEPVDLARLRNDGSLSPQLPAGTPFGLVGTSSLYKRESYPNGAVPPG